MFKYHDSLKEGIPDYEELTQIYCNREKMWDELLAALDNEKRFEWTSQEICDVLRSIQEYCALDFPQSRNFSKCNLRVLVDQVCRVAIALAEHGVSEKDRYYVSSKLYRALREITDDK